MSVQAVQISIEKPGSRCGSHAGLRPDGGRAQRTDHELLIHRLDGFDDGSYGGLWLRRYDQGGRTPVAQHGVRRLGF